MERINTGTIPNYANLDADALRAFIESFEYDNGAAEIRRLLAENQRLQEKNDGLSKENAEWKRKHRESLSEEERKEAERKEADEKKDRLIAELTRENTVNAHKSQFAAAGYSAELAEKAAVALADNDAATLFEVQSAFLQEHDKGIRVENLHGMPMPAARAPGGGKETKDMSYDELVDFLNAHPDANLN